MEINAGYPRLDLDEFNSRSACEAGVMISIDTDAHSTAELSEIQFGLTVARRAALTARHILNCQPLKDLRVFLGRKR
jgi:DNA polymerase (family 10)